MKGIVFTEFLEMVESDWSLDMVDRLIEGAGVSGAYTAVGDYPDTEILALVAALSRETGTPAPALMRSFGARLFGRLARSYPGLFPAGGDSFRFLAGLEDIVHAQVRKLYPDAELPTFAVEERGDALILTYFSQRPFADLVHGFAEGCVSHYGDSARVIREAPVAGSGAQARFIVQRLPAP